MSASIKDPQKQPQLTVCSHMDPLASQIVENSTLPGNGDTYKLHLQSQAQLRKPSDVDTPYNMRHFTNFMLYMREFTHTSNTLDNTYESTTGNNKLEPVSPPCTQGRSMLGQTQVWFRLLLIQTPSYRTLDHQNTREATFRCPNWTISIYTHNIDRHIPKML